VVRSSQAVKPGVPESHEKEKPKRGARGRDHENKKGPQGRGNFECQASQSATQGESVDMPEEGDCIAQKWGLKKVD